MLALCFVRIQQRSGHHQRLSTSLLNQPLKTLIFFTLGHCEFFCGSSMQLFCVRKLQRYLLLFTLTQVNRLQQHQLAIIQL